jgi:hypothetical protein
MDNIEDGLRLVMLQHVMSFLWSNVIAQGRSGEAALAEARRVAEASLASIARVGGEHGDISHRLVQIEADFWESVMERVRAMTSDRA